MNESLQIDFLAVKSGEKSGDAIVFRYGDFSARELFKVVVIDGGTLQSGDDIVEHIKDYYDTNHVDVVICTHPDADHASGLRQVLNKCSVSELWIHKPWEHSEHICDLFHDGRITDNSLSERLQEAYNYARELTDIAEKRGIEMREPFAGRKSEDGYIEVLGPSVDYYRELIPMFTKSPQQKGFFAKAFTSITESITEWVEETFDVETLDNTGETSAENLSSVVLLLTLNGEKFLFTGDAGMESLQKVLDYCLVNNIDISNIRFMQVPHHGSKRNISPVILDAIKCRKAFISASKDSIKHPSKKVINALTRRGAKVFSTEGLSICHKMNADSHANYGPATPHPFYDKVEA